MPQRLTLFLTPETILKLKQEALSQNMTASAYVTKLIENDLQGYKKVPMFNTPTTNPDSFDT